MQTFTTRVSASVLWTAVFLPPAVFFVLLQCWGGAGTSAGFSAYRLFTLLALSQAMPLAALAWMLCSVAGCSVSPGRLILHRVVGDRAYPLSALDGRPARQRDVIMVALAGRRLRLRIRVENPQSLLAALCDAQTPARGGSVSAIEGG